MGALCLGLAPLGKRTPRDRNNFLHDSEKRYDLLMDWIELAYTIAIITVTVLFGVPGNDKAARPAPMEVCLAGKTVTIWEDQWEECFHRFGGTCGRCGMDGKCPKRDQDPTCTIVEEKP